MKMIMIDQVHRSNRRLSTVTPTLEDIICVVVVAVAIVAVLATIVDVISIDDGGDIQPSNYSSQPLQD